MADDDDNQGAADTEPAATVPEAPEQERRDGKEKSMRGGFSSVLDNMKFETIGSISAIIVSVAAIIVAWDQAMVMRAQQHAAVWPILDTYFITDYDENRLYFRLIYENAGVGPAVIQRTRFFLDDQQIVHYSELGPYLPERLYYDYQVSGGGFARALGPERQDTVLQIDWPRGEETDAAWTQLRDRSVSGVPPVLIAEVCYCSVFDRCWITHTGNTAPPTRVQSCELTDADNYNFLTEFTDQDGTGSGLSTDAPASDVSGSEVPQGNPTTEAGVIPTPRKP